jgi:hypothetical protein
MEPDPADAPSAREAASQRSHPEAAQPPREAVEISAAELAGPGLDPADAPSAREAAAGPPPRAASPPPEAAPFVVSTRERVAEPRLAREQIEMPAPRPPAARAVRHQLHVLLYSCGQPYARLRRTAVYLLVAAFAALLGWIVGSLLT